MIPILQLFVDMGMDSNEIYENDFEKYFLQDTAKFYKRAASTWLNEDGGNFTYLRRYPSLYALVASPPTSKANLVVHLHGNKG